MSQLESRREFTQRRANELVNQLGRAKDLLGSRACVYATGSFGRLEATAASDLDIFIVSCAASGEVDDRGLSRLDEICVKADLIDSIRRLEIKDFDGDGKYLQHHKVTDFISNIGGPEDDNKNTLTGRLLLFLESRPLLGEGVYKRVIEDVVAAYWRDYEDHKSDFVPAYLVNDILRLWRTFCVNYEARTRRDPEEEKIKRKVKNYKLKFSRMLTCYSALLYLLHIFVKDGTVAPEDAVFMTQMTPTQRLEWLIDQGAPQGKCRPIKDLLVEYENFLNLTNKEEEVINRIFSNKELSEPYFKSGYRFGDLMFEALNEVGAGSRLLRLIAV